MPIRPTRHLAAARGLGLFAASFHMQAHAQATPAGLWKTIDDESKKEKSLIRITEAGGVGGDPLRELAERKLLVVIDEIEKWNLDIDVISVGGITEPAHALKRLSIHPRVKAVQINSGIYKKGFSLIRNTLAAIHASRVA